MKIRNGFVSNSSSSSFILVTTQDNWQRAKEKLHPYYVTVAAAIMTGPIEVFGTKLVHFNTYSNHGGSWGDWIDIEYEGDYPPSEWVADGEAPDVYTAWDMVEKELQLGDCLTHNQDVG